MKPTLHSSARAFGKVILFGEHSVVHGFPALAAGLPDGLILEARPLDDERAHCQVEIPDWSLSLELTPDSEHPVARACSEVLAYCDGPATGWAIRGRSRLPARAGLGSSAALSVAMARLVLGPDAAPEPVVEASLAGERIFHGNPSGIDSEVAARGGVLEFVRGEAPRPFVFPTALPLLIVPSQIPRSTATQVGYVRERLERFPRVVEPVLGALGACVSEAKSALEHQDLGALGLLMDIAHDLLSSVGVSIPAIDVLCAEAKSAGALGAKLTGAGGGGCIIALAPAERQQALMTSFRQRELAPFCVEIDS